MLQFMRKSKTLEWIHLFSLVTTKPCFTLQIAMDNKVAHSSKEASKLQDAGDSVGEPVEVSTLRREDLAFHRGEYGLHVWAGAVVKFWSKMYRPNNHLIGIFYQSELTS